MQLKIDVGIADSEVPPRDRYRVEKSKEYRARFSSEE